MITGLILVLLFGMANRSAPKPYQVVVNAANPLSVAPSIEISGLFLRHQMQWSTGGIVIPVDQVPGARVRQEFSMAVHGRPVQAVQAFWRQRVFAGIAVPPVELSSDADVLEYVRATPGAIGYVSAGISVGDGVRVVEVR